MWLWFFFVCLFLTNNSVYFRIRTFADFHVFAEKITYFAKFELYPRKANFWFQTFTKSWQFFFTLNHDFILTDWYSFCPKIRTTLELHVFIVKSWPFVLKLQLLQNHNFCYKIILIIYTIMWFFLISQSVIGIYFFWTKVPNFFAIAFFCHKIITLWQKSLVVSGTSMVAVTWKQLKCSSFHSSFQEEKPVTWLHGPSTVKIKRHWWCNCQHELLPFLTAWSFLVVWQFS